METYTPEQLLSLWRREESAPETITGHILQNLVRMQRALNAHGHPTRACPPESAGTPAPAGHSAPQEGQNRRLLRSTWPEVVQGGRKR